MSTPVPSNRLELSVCPQCNIHEEDISPGTCGHSWHEWIHRVYNANELYQADRFREAADSFLHAYHKDFKRLNHVADRRGQPLLERLQASYIRSILLCSLCDFDAASASFLRTLELIKQVRGKRGL
ncbi:hypothetical protein HDU76_008701 [Blyttiomyces sp. JEL0837]|nr:hypothetical protein HDU76_008701 [Blyttiomyces sp. JEL0837]